MDANDHERLSYRALAERLAISPDAARMKAKRKAWRIIPGNHPNDPVMVEVPLAALVERVPRERPERKAPRTTTPEHPNNLTERLFDELTAARARNDDLTDRLIEAKDVLTAAYNKLIALNQELVSARIEVLTAKDEVIRVKDALEQDGRELAAAEAREMGTKAELERALADLAALERQINRPQRPWWKGGQK